MFTVYLNLQIYRTIFFFALYYKHYSPTTIKNRNNNNKRQQQQQQGGLTLTGEYNLTCPEFKKKGKGKRGTRKKKEGIKVKTGVKKGRKGDKKRKKGRRRGKLEERDITFHSVLKSDIITFPSCLREEQKT